MKLLGEIKYSLPLFLLLLIFNSCREPKTAVSCSGVNQTGAATTNSSGDSKKKHISHRQKKSKGQDGFVAKDKTVKRSARKAEKGKKKERNKTKAEKKFNLFRKKQEAGKDADVKVKSNSKKNERQQKKVKKKKMKHPENGNPPKGQI